MTLSCPTSAFRTVAVAALFPSFLRPKTTRTWTLVASVRIVYPGSDEPTTDGISRNSYGDPERGSGVAPAVRSQHAQPRPFLDPSSCGMSRGLSHWCEAGRRGGRQRK